MHQPASAQQVYLFTLPAVNGSDPLLRGVWLSLSHIIILTTSSLLCSCTPKGVERKTMESMNISKVMLRNPTDGGFFTYSLCSDMTQHFIDHVELTTSAKLRWEEEIRQVFLAMLPFVSRDSVLVLVVISLPEWALSQTSVQWDGECWGLKGFWFTCWSFAITLFN